MQINQQLRQQVPRRVKLFGQLSGRCLFFHQREWQREARSSERTFCTARWAHPGGLILGLGNCVWSFVIRTATESPSVCSGVFLLGIISTHVSDSLLRVPCLCLWCDREAPLMAKDTLEMFLVVWHSYSFSLRFFLSLGLSLHICQLVHLHLSQSTSVCPFFFMHLHFQHVVSPRLNQIRQPLQESRRCK